MKLFWSCGLLLTLLLAAGIASSIGVRQMQSPITQQLEQATQAGTQADWEQADALFSAALARWEKYREALAAFIDHGPMEEIDSLFEELKIYIGARDSLRFSALCSRLCQLTQAIGDSHLLSWWNLL